MPGYIYKGFVSKTLYRYALMQAENAAGQVTLNGELCQRVNTDGSIQRGYAGPSPTVYDAGAVYSPWEQH